MLKVSSGCDICRIPRFVNEKQRAEHLAGKKHAHASAAVEVDRAKQAVPEAGCRVCSIHKFVNEKQRAEHLAGKKHKANSTAAVEVGVATVVGVGATTTTTAAAAVRTTGGKKPKKGKTKANAGAPPSGQAGKAPPSSKPTGKSFPPGSATKRPQPQRVRTLEPSVDRQRQIAGSNAKAKGKTAAAAAGAAPFNFPEWSEEPVWTSDAEQLILAELKRIEDGAGVEAGHHEHCPHAKSGSCGGCSRPWCRIHVSGKAAEPWKVMKALDGLVGGLLARGYKKQGGSAASCYDIVQQVQKGVAFRNMETLKAKSDSAVQKIRQERNPSDLKTLGYELNIPTTELGFLLAGDQAMYHVNEHPEDVHVQFDDPDIAAASGDGAAASSAASNIRRRWAEEACKAVGDDFISGNRLPSSHGSAVSDRAGEAGETELIKALERAGVARSEYLVERELVEKEFRTGNPGARATPDVKFHSPIKIGGRKVGWIDAKRKLLIPGVSSDRELTSFDEQVERYTARYGPGAILWAGKGFCASMLDRNPSVAHFALVDSKATSSTPTKVTPKKPKKKKKKKQQQQQQQQPRPAPTGYHRQQDQYTRVMATTIHVAAPYHHPEYCSFQDLEDRVSGSSSMYHPHQAATMSVLGGGRRLGGATSGYTAEHVAETPESRRAQRAAAAERRAAMN